VETLKAFLSRPTDWYRPPYGLSHMDVPRTGIFIGSTNEQDYLRDTTGNTRMWPVWCETVDLRWIELNRDQLWAEAAEREAMGEAQTLWLDTPELQEEAARLTARRMREEIWQPLIARWIDKTEAERAEALKRLADHKDDEEYKKTKKDGDLFVSREPIYVARVLEHAIGMNRDRMNRQADMRVSAVLKAMGGKAFRGERLPKIKNRPARGTTTVWRMPKPDKKPEKPEKPENETTA